MRFAHWIILIVLPAASLAQAETVECYCADGRTPVGEKCLLPTDLNGQTTSFGNAICNSSYNDSNDVIESGNYSAIAAIPKKADPYRPWLPSDRHIYSWKTRSEISAQQAESAALQHCREGTRSRKQEKDCRIIASYHNACSARVSGYVVKNGKAVYKEYFKISKKPNAHNLALAECQSEPGTMNNCWVTSTDCFIEHGISRTKKMQRMQKR
ncbi:Uncharacterised protein [Kingella potus]|uniref:DUF4189 domain-containing protein n=1 Tax=Kingella potus TaxID=265175 RepID=A0A377R175_9NEIS|nr:DUF4189 domain-containing protein [Kingella potus]UOP00320.1 DUF4189 domain-containing protein [Kingella potus]STR02620.1 Uncharacterised protein [Kingella potus]